jgi:hypothetical protein
MLQLTPFLPPLKLSGGSCEAVMVTVAMVSSPPCMTWLPWRFRFDVGVII